MTFPVWLNNLIAYSLQIAILAAAGTLLAYVFRLRAPRVTLIYWQLLLLACLFVPFMQSWQHPVMHRVIPVHETTAAEIPQAADVAIPISLKPAKPFPWEIVLIILAAGIILRLLWLVIGFIRLHLFRRKSQLFIQELSVIQNVQSRTGVRADVYLSDAIHSPVTFGFRSPAIILPLAFKDLSEACKQAVLCHELLHVRRYDWILIIAEEVIHSIFWFHPAVWWLLNRIHLSREQSVDYEVVQLTGNKQPYLDSLLEFARTHKRMNAVPAPLFLRERHLVQRVALIIKEVSMSRSRLTASMAGITALLAWTFYLAAGWFPLTGAPVFAQEQAAGSEIKTPLTIAPVPAPMPGKTQIAGLITKTLPAAASALATVTAAPAQDPTAVPEIKAPQREPLRVGGNIKEGLLIHKVNPEYPEPAKRVRISETVKLMVTVNEEGFVSDIQVIQGHPLLNEAAIAAVKQWQYSPTVLNGQPVPIQGMVNVPFGTDPDGLPADMKPSGNMSSGPERLEKILNSAGPGGVFLIEKSIPCRIAENVIRDAMLRGVQIEIISGPVVLYQGQEYSISQKSPSRVNFAGANALLKTLHEALEQVKTANKGKPIMLNYLLHINEAGQAVGIERLGDEYPEFEKELILFHGEPATYNGEPAPCANQFQMYVPG